MTLGANGAHLGVRASRSLPAMRLARELQHPLHNTACCRRCHSWLPRMTDSSFKAQLWHLGRGFVFASGTEVVYPRLPLAKLHSSAIVPEGGEDKITMSSVCVHTVDRDSSLQGTASAVNVRSRSPGETANPVAATDGVEDGATRDGALTADESASNDPPFTPLDFKVSAEAFREAKLAEPGTPESFWSYNMYRGPSEDGSTEDAKVKVHYCKSKHTTERVLQQYFMKEKVLGFDLEWASTSTRFQSARQNVSLVQLASPSRIALFHLALYPKNDDLVAPSLKKIMEDPDVTKVGVAIKGDCTRLRKFLEIDSRGIFELSHLYKLVKYSTSKNYGYVNKKMVSLARQAEEYLYLPLFKGSDVRSSDWSQPLQMGQIIYSASDAYAGLQLYYTLDHQRKCLDPVPPLPHHANLNLPIRLADGVSISTSDEVSEAAEGEDGGKIGPRLTARYLKSIGGTINIEPDGEDSEPILKDVAKPKSTTTSSQKGPKDPKIVDAEIWLTQYRQSHAGAVRAAPASLRAYRIWYDNEDLDPGAIAELLRQPPLQKTTVVYYILEAIRLEKLPYRAARLQTEVLDLIPEVRQVNRYTSLVKACRKAVDDASTESAGQ